MTIKDEIKFWQRAVKILEKDYEKPCREFNKDCVGCQANQTITWIIGHIDLLKWELKSKK